MFSSRLLFSILVGALVGGLYHFYPKTTSLPEEDVKNTIQFSAIVTGVLFILMGMYTVKSKLSFDKLDTGKAPF